ncbi:putative PEP-CTERM system TPR-repeat lipoprotein [Rubrivivax gelatinosus]|uniref:XrtA/PEP-CTERM system TPR-repeat protein PrsT n=2 Tax=Rubrivivax gelatinosus TaxID=28068 RepID=UPI0018CAF88F|nr:XrtA/PEP-CTERM system TPR-repeat protein PrsT [Rubrivivax gelatinosus]MBG6080367.1 putative PEP-CTERM system TPR-repeat lipoprotein [Rubrivivax gelatinosus]
MKTLTRSAATLAVAALLAACGGPSADELLATAKDSLAQHDTKSATISLKSALQKNSDLAEARLLLGTTLLASGDAAGASVELRKAAQLKLPEARVVPPLARALLATGEERRIVQTWADTTLGQPAADADLATTLAQAYLKLDQAEKAAAAVDAALKAQPDWAPAMLLKARLLASRQDVDGALALVERMTTADPKQADAWLLKGQLEQYGRHDRDAALAAYRRAVEADARKMTAHQALVGLLVAGGQLDAAEAHVQQLAKTLPDVAGTKLLQAQIAYLRGDYEGVRKLTQPLVQATPNNPVVLQLAGAAEYQLRALPQAETLLAKAVQLQPGMPLATGLLAQIYLRGGQADKALALLQPELDGGKPRAETLLLAGQAHLQNGQAHQAEAAFAQAAKLAPQDPRARTALAMGKIGRGDAAGLGELETLAAGDSGVGADMALIASLLRRGDRAKALKAIDALDAKRPHDPTPELLRGRVLLTGGDRAGARAAFDRATKRDATYFPAVASLAALDLADGKAAAARQRFDAEIAHDPKNWRAMLALAEWLERTGAGADAVSAQLAAAVKAAPNEALPRLRLIDDRLARRDARGALAAARDATTALPSSADLLAAQARAELASQDYQQALTSFQKLSQMLPRSPAGLLGQSDAHLGLKDPAAAERALKSALDLAPKLVPAQRALIGLYTADGRYAEAVALAREIQKQRPAEAVGYLAEAEVELARRKPEAALAVLRSAVQKAPGADTAIRLHAALRATGHGDEAERFAAGWQKQHAEDLAFRFHLGDEALARQDWAGAEARYREVLSRQPNNPLALNNVAWLLLKQGKPGALAMAEKANTVAPGQAALRDTLALAAAAEGQLPRALALQKDTVQRAPEAPALRLTLAKLLLQSGDKAGARAELDKLAKLGPGFDGQTEVAELLKKVS